MSTDSTTATDPRLKRMSFRAWHRGMKELDLILGRYADESLARMSAEDLDVFEQILELHDVTLYRWLSGRETIPPEIDSAILRALKARCDAGAIGI